MKITDMMIKKGEPFIELIYKDDFIQKMISGDLDKEAVAHYLKADSVYLAKFSDIYAILIAKVKDTNQKKFFLSQIDFILNQEVSAHYILEEYVGNDYHDIIKNADWYPSSDHYIKHMFYQIHQESIAHILAAMGPCPWIYKQVAQKILNQENISDNNPFKKWIAFYGSDAMDSCIDYYFDIINAYAEKMTEVEQKQLVRVFLESCQHERQFFQMSVDQEDWYKEVKNV